MRRQITSRQGVRVRPDHRGRLVLVTGLFVVGVLGGPAYADLEILRGVRPRGISGNNIVLNKSRGEDYLYDGSTYTRLPKYPGSYETFYDGIGATGLVGMYRGSGAQSFPDYGFVYDGSQFTSLHYPGGYSTWPQGISGKNVVGDYATYQRMHGFLYDGTHYTSLDYPGASETLAYAVSGNTVVGRYKVGESYHGYIYDGSGFTDVADLPGAAEFGLASTSSCAAVGISGNTILGAYLGSGIHGFLYDGSRFTPLDYPDRFVQYGRFVGISGDKIIGEFQPMYDPYGAWYTFVGTAPDFRLVIPTPVPGAALLGILGLSCAGWRLRRRQTA